jgi:hypothetical protein
MVEDACLVVDLFGVWGARFRVWGLDALTIIKMNLIINAL